MWFRVVQPTTIRQLFGHTQRSLGDHDLVVNWPRATVLLHRDPMNRLCAVHRWRVAVVVIGAQPLVPGNQLPQGGVRLLICDDKRQRTFPSLPALESSDRDERRLLDRT